MGKLNVDETEIQILQIEDQKVLWQRQDGMENIRIQRYCV